MTDRPHTETDPALDLDSGADARAPTTEAYRVLARKYRPVDFSALIGQDALVRTLSNAIQSGRIAHAFVLTGVRGVGKTTTARIIARALNCIGPDGTGGPTIEPCGVCEPCVAISESRHIDVLEMDAASRTGIDDVREIIDGVRYLPASARYKVFIIDEVHMLSKQAFNGLLKTLEEPPPHVVFVFATTEIRKVPVTVLSRCQRFDLRRVEAARLIEHLAWIAGEEGIAVEQEALALIARAAEGSVRDALSILDQAIAHAAGPVRAQPVREMLGLADRTRVLDLFEALMRGEVAAALAEFRDQYESGADPVAVLQDLLEVTHWVTRIKLAPEAAGDSATPEEERTRGQANAQGLGIPVLSRAWQMLLKGLSETRDAPQPVTAAEMALIRLAYAADLPDPADLVRTIRDGGAAPEPAARTAPASPAGKSSATRGAPAVATASAQPVPAMEERREMPAPRAEARPVAVPDFAALVALADVRGESRLKAYLETMVHLVRFEDGRIEFRPATGAPATLPNELSERLAVWTGRRWIVTVSNAPGAPTLAQQAKEADAALKERMRRDPAVAPLLAAFPGADVVNIRNLVDIGASEGTAAPSVLADIPSDADVEDDDDLNEDA